MDSATLLFRQVHPSWRENERVTSQAFTPTPKDNRQLSVYDGDQTTAETSWLHYTRELGHASIGVVAVTVGECDGQGRPVVPDPAPYRAHAFIDFGGLSLSQARNVGKALAGKANARGWLYGPVVIAETP